MRPSSTCANCSRTVDRLIRAAIPDVRPRLLPYAGLLDARAPEDIDLLVVHCTELPDLSAAREFGEKVHYPASGTGNSGHYYIDRDGTVELWVPENRIAHHVRGYNPRSLGVELVNRGRYPDWFHSASQHMDEHYPDVQIEALAGLIRMLSRRLPRLRYIAGHEDLDRATVAASDDASVSVRRKLDPGPHFPWARVLAACDLERLAAQPAG